MADTITYNACISACEKSGLWALAMQLFSQMLSSGPALGGVCAQEAFATDNVGITGPHRFCIALFSFLTYILRVVC